jgi:hypothetical protein
MNNIQPIAPPTAPVWPEVNAVTVKNSMAAPQVGAAEVPIRDSVIATGKTDLPQHKTLSDTVEAPYREMVREWVGAQLEVRPGVVKKGLEWNSDPSYPSLNALNGIATLFVTSALNDGTIS